MPAKAVKKLPVGETGSGVQCRTKSGKRYVVSQNPLKGQHTLWAVDKAGYTKLGSAQDPYALYEKIPWGE